LGYDVSPRTPRKKPWEYVGIEGKIILKIDFEEIKEVLMH
jgi:hypothetical protein